MAGDTLVVAFENADPTQVERLGAKGAKLVEDYQHIREFFPGMEEAVAVPDGFILSTDCWKLYREAGDTLPDHLFQSVLKELASLESRRRRKFGDLSGNRPLIVAVRGGAPISLPGAIATVLNVGLNDEVVEALIHAGDDASVILTTYLTAIRMYGEVVLDIPYEHFYRIIKGAGDEGTFSVPLVRGLIRSFKEVLAEALHPRFPPGFEYDLTNQLRNAIEAVFASNSAPPAVEARRSRQKNHGESLEEMGTAVVIQEMVFGNLNETNCLSGVFFTRDPRTGANCPIIEWAPKVQCDKIVSGKLRKRLMQAMDLRERFPSIYEQLMLVREKFEARARRPLDMEFTVENGKLYLLQRRPLRMTSNGTVRAMWDFVDEGKTSIQQASMVINKALEQPEKILAEDFRDYRVLARGIPITDSAEAGILVFGTEDALELARKGESVILLRKRPYGENTVAVNHPQIKGIVRYDGNTTGHEAVSAVAYSKPYLINTVDADGKPLVFHKSNEIVLNPQSSLFEYLGKRVFIDGERGILGSTARADFLVDRRIQKKLYVDWEFLREQFDSMGYDKYDYSTLVDIHYEWELELERYQQMEKNLREGQDLPTQSEMLKAFANYLGYIPEKDRLRVLQLKDVHLEDFRFDPVLRYTGKDLGSEIQKIIRTLMLCTTWRTHWVHELMVLQARQRGETENDVIRDIFIKNRTMSLVRGFEQDGFHVMKAADRYHLILASNFEYGEDLDKLQIGPGTLNYAEKEVFARQFLSYLAQVNPGLHDRIRLVQGEPPLGQGHARIVSIGLSISEVDFDIICRYLRTFLDQCRHGCPLNLQEMIPREEFLELYHVDPFFAPYPDFMIKEEVSGERPTGDCLLIFGRCSFGELEGVLHGEEEYERLCAQVKQFEGFLKGSGQEIPVRPWQFEVDPYRRHSVIGAVGIRLSRDHFPEILENLKRFLKEPGSSD
ncbi:MAG: hypothetical protein GX443_08920 [Deltaproteobacteria bacterium]|nr:hypothetical protein [Deltaproteobacteria bacterium]